MNSEDLADKMWSWFIRQRGRPSLEELDGQLAELSRGQPLFVVANARRRVLAKINEFSERFAWENHP
jgi:hypothetical protein